MVPLSFAGIEGLGGGRRGGEGDLMSAGALGLGGVPKQIEYGVYRDLSITYPKLYSIYLRGTINPKP